MIDMRGWKSKTVDVLKDVHLDPRNVRLDLESNAPEADIMLDLFQNEKALSLVEAIAKVGYLTHEVPIVVNRDGKLIVVEGNRRLAALKAIQNPYLVADFQSRVTALAKDIPDRDALRKVEVKIAPNQADADQLIATLHTGAQRRPWGPARQAAFFQAQIDAGQTYADLLAHYPTVDVDKFVLRSLILYRFKKVKYPTPELTDFVKGRSLSVATLARIYESKEFIDFAGLKLTKAGDLRLSLPKKTFDAAAVLIMQGIADGDIDTRSVGTVTSPRFRELMDDLRALVTQKPGSDAGGGGSGGSQGGSGSDPKGGSSTGGSTGGYTGGSTGKGGSASGKRPSAKKHFLGVARLSAPTGFPPSIDQILREFSTLNVERYPNAAFDLLRTLLEKTIKSFAVAKGETIPKAGKNQGGFIFLSDCLVWLEKWFAVQGPRSHVQVVKKVRSTQIGDFAGSADHLNAINHNHLITASPNEVRVASDSTQSLISEMLK